MAFREGGERVSVTPEREMKLERRQGQMPKGSVATRSSFIQMKAYPNCLKSDHSLDVPEQSTMLIN